MLSIVILKPYSGVLSLCKGVAHNSTLKALILDSIMLGSDKYTSPLHKTLTVHNTTLNRLDFNKNNLHGLPASTFAIPRLPPLTSPANLFLVTELFSALETSKGLLYFQLNETGIGNEGAAILFRYIAQNCPLRRLHIADNGITKLEVPWEQISVLTELNLAV
jgi:hypothetical protein